MPLPTLDIALRGATVALLLVLAASLFRGFRVGVGGACRELFDRGHVAGVDRARASDRAVDR